MTVKHSSTRLDLNSLPTIRWFPCFIPDNTWPTRGCSISETTKGEVRFKTPIAFGPLGTALGQETGMFRYPPGSAPSSLAALVGLQKELPGADFAVKTRVRHILTGHDVPRSCGGSRSRLPPFCL